MQSTIETIHGFGDASVATSAVGTTGIPIRWNNAVLTAVFGMLVGTGGFANPHLVNYAPSGPIAVRVAHTPNESMDAGSAVLDTQEKLAAIRRYLSMNLSDVAQAMHVARPTIYAWLRDDPHLRSKHAKRLDAIYRFASTWRSLSDRPVGTFLYRQTASTKTLIDLLSEKTLDNSAVHGAFSQIRESLSKSVSPRSVVDVAKARGFKLAERHSGGWSSNDVVDV
jgi:hypothetical protein